MIITANDQLAMYVNVYDEHGVKIPLVERFDTETMLGWAYDLSHGAELDEATGKYALKPTKQVRIARYEYHNVPASLKSLIPPGAPTYDGPDDPVEAPPPILVPSSTPT